MNVDPQNLHCTQQGNFFGFPDVAIKLYHDSVVWRGCSSSGSVHQDQCPYPQIYSINPRDSNGLDIYHKYPSVNHELAPGFVRSIYPPDGVIGATCPALSGQYRGQPASSVTQNTLQSHRLGPNHPAMDPGAPHFTPTHSQSPLAGFMVNFALPLDDESIMESNETRARSLPPNLQKLYATLSPKIRDPLTLDALISILDSEDYRMHHVSDEELSKLMHIRDQPKAQSGKGSKISILEYRCLLCHRFLTVKKHQAREHALNHLEVKPIACLYTQCEKRFLRSYDAARHQGRVHQVMKPLNTKGGSRKAVRRFVLTKNLGHQYYYDEPTTNDPEVPLKLRHGEVMYMSAIWSDPLGELDMALWKLADALDSVSKILFETFRQARYLFFKAGLRSRASHQFIPELEDNGRFLAVDCSFVGRFFLISFLNFVCGLISKSMRFASVLIHLFHHPRSSLSEFRCHSEGKMKFLPSKSCFFSHPEHVLIA